MSQYELPYGATKLKLTLPDTLNVELVQPAEVAPAPDALTAVQQALDKPLSQVRLEDFAMARSVAIAINDKTRPVPHEVLLPPLLARLEAAGIPKEAITLLIATGTHVPTPPEGFGDVVPPKVLARYRVISHDCDASDLIACGTTARGTSLWLNPHFANADLRIVVGNIEPHHFAGFSGGVKSAVIGLAGRATVTANHSLLVDDRATLARYDDNPLRQDIEELGELAEVHFALNAVMNRHKHIVSVFAGAPQAVMQAAIPVVRRIYEVPVAAPFDLMITSPGGYPKDINLYQAHKAVTPAFNVTKAGGAIILVAACVDGVGHARYAAWMAKHNFASHTAVLAQFKRESFQLGPHKAFLFARQAARLCGIWVVSDIPSERLHRLLLQPASLDEAVMAVLPLLESGARVGIIPYANATIPALNEGV